MRTFVKGFNYLLGALCCSFFTLCSYGQRSSASVDENETSFTLILDYRNDYYPLKEKDSTSTLYQNRVAHLDNNKALRLNMTRTLTSVSAGRCYLSPCASCTRYVNGHARTMEAADEDATVSFRLAFAEAENFNFSIPLDYTLYRFNIYVVSGYDLPVNANEILRKAKMASGTTEATAWSDRMNNMFAFTVGIRYSL